MRYLTTIVLAGLIWGGAVAEAQSPLTGQWMFHPGDDAAWASPAYQPDTSWDAVTVPAYWETQGFAGYDGFGWYRTNFVVSDDLLSRTAPLFLVAGFIDDVDQVYFNGAQLGQTGKFPPESATQFSALRQYRIPRDLLKKENTLAIRVYDSGGPGGLYRGPVGIYTKEQIQQIHKINSTPHRSFYQLPTSNGLVAGIYNTKNHAITQFLDHVYQKYDSATNTRNLLESAKYQVILDTTQFDLAKYSADSAGYENGSGIITGRFQLDPVLHLSTYHFAPFAFDGRILVSIAELTGAGVKDAAVNLNVQNLAKEAVHLSQTYEYTNDRIVQVHVLGVHPNGRNAILPKVRNFLTDFPGMTSLYNEREFWDTYHAEEQLPENLSSDERALAKQSTAILKMGQVREHGRPFGQILASLPPGQWNISWARDMAYAVEALIRTGHYTEARDALQFQLQAQVGEYEHFIWNGMDYGIQAPYQISVCRYYGNSAEWSDHNENGPNIELDGFGLFLWTLESYMQSANDVAFVREYWELISQRIADPLVQNIDGYKLIRRDSGPWERHLPGKHFTYTSVAAVKGLDAAANMALAVNDTESAEKYLAAANKISQGFRLYLVDSKTQVIKGNLESALPEEYLDGSAIEAINFELDGAVPRARNTMQALNTHLKMDKTKQGYKRIPAGDWYDRQEWIVLDMRIASAWFLLGERYRGNTLITWVTQQSRLNYNLIAELYDEYTADYRGATPMVGFGAGTYLIALYDRMQYTK